MAFPASFALARVRHGALCAAVLVVAPLFVLLYPYEVAAAVPYASGTLWARTAILTGVAALAIRLGLRSRAARERRGTT
ncbi:hypothetical protein PV341_11080 [Streptomyces sp. PA03-1a]|nr:hypothetical protein [Streptomyces sp. PA03-1a]MDX2817078.1 hypothetical protein [Streptomyces sp. PA03-5A]